MKFSNSERVLHNIQYNPPCNYYKIDKSQNKKLVSGSLAGPILLNENKNTFGYQKRFQNAINNKIPGPGQYFQPKKQLIYDFKKDLSNPKYFLKNTFRNSQQNPSIPYKILSQQNLDQEDRLFLKQLSLIQNPARAAQSIKKKQPSYSFAKSPRKLLPQNQQYKKQRSINNIHPDILQAQLRKIDQKQYYESIPQQKNDKNKRKIVEFNEAIKKSSKKRNEIINNIGPDFVPSLQLIDLMSKMRTKYVPGPGSYHLNKERSISTAADSIVQQAKKGAIFSTVKRFDVDKKNILGPGSYQINYQSLSKKGGLITKQKRKLFGMKQQTDIQYRFYINPDSESKITINNVPQRSNSCANFRKKNLSESNQPLNAFGSSSRRFSTITNRTNEQDNVSQISEYELKKRQNFKIQLKAKLKKLNTQDRRSTKQDSGLLGIGNMALAMD